jgi:hypothetical protein
MGVLFSEVLVVNTNICFSIRELCIKSFEPKVTQPKIGRIVKIENGKIEIELRSDFKI